MKRLITPSMALAATLALAACGSSGNSSVASATGHAASATGSPAGIAGAKGSSKTVSVRRLPGVGTVLVNRGDMALYTPAQEASGKILCTGACTAIWKPLKPGAGAPTAASGVGKLGVIKRPDGIMQVTADHRPLYTFAEDSPGKATGNGASDHFGGHTFNWHAVGPGGKTLSAAAPKSGGGAAAQTGSYSPY
jgi:predicted lipoprotein with Yx(FWY)xxD motif